MLKISVSNLEQFNKYIHNEWFTFEMLEEQITTPFKNTIEMDIGTDFHSIIENYSKQEPVNGFYKGKLTGALFPVERISEFVMPLIDRQTTDRFEVSNKKIYNALEPVLVSGRADILSINRIVDIKTMNNPNMDEKQFGYYLNSMQWKYYLDMYNCDRFIYKVFAINYNNRTNQVGILDYYPLEFNFQIGIERDIIANINDALEIIHQNKWEEYYLIKDKQTA